MREIKGWRHRHSLFSRFDDGIQFDKEGFESSKSEAVAQFIARHLAGKTVLDCFTGLGGCAIAFAQQGKQVISVDINRERSRMAQNNAAIYGVERRISFVVGDITKLWHKFDFDAAYFDPPWGGVGYEKFPRLKFSSFRPNVLPLIKGLIHRGRNVACTLPLNFDPKELKRIKKDGHLHYNQQYGEPYCVHCIWIANTGELNRQRRIATRAAVTKIGTLPCLAIHQDTTRMGCGA